MSDLTAVAAEVAAVDWFARLGTPLDDTDRTAALAYAHSLMVRDANIRVARSFAECSAFLQQPAGPTWAHEESLRVALRDQLHAQRSEESWARAFTRVIDPAAAATNQAATAALARLQVDDPYARYVMGGAALHAVHLLLLARAAGVPDDHPFVLCFELYRRGRWLLGMNDAELYLW